MTRLRALHLPHGCLAQLVERRLYTANVGGSIPSAPTNPPAFVGPSLHQVQILRLSGGRHSGGPVARSADLRLLFTSGEFLFVFLPITLLVFFAAARFVGKAVAAGWLAVASLAFYGYWRIEHTALLVAPLSSTTASASGSCVPVPGANPPRVRCWPSRSARISPRSRTSNTRTFFLRTGRRPVGRGHPASRRGVAAGHLLLHVHADRVPRRRPRAARRERNADPLRAVRHLLPAPDRRARYCITRR